jgi:archaellin
MAITDALSDAWHGLEDKAWSLSDFLEDKGIPLSSFCQDKNISPMWIFLGIIIAIILILSLASGDVASGDAVLILRLNDETGNPIQADFDLVHTQSDRSVAGESGRDGRATVPELAHGDYTLTIVSTQYSGSTPIKIDKDETTVTFKVTTKKGTLRVSANNEEGGYIATGSIEVRKFPGNEIVETKQISGASSYDFELPVGTYKVIIRSVSGGELESQTKQVDANQVAEVSFSVSEEAASSAGVKIIVKDENGNALPGAYVVLYNARNDAALGAQQQTDASGQTTFTNIPVGTSVYPTAFMPSNRRYGQLDALSSKNKRITVRDSLETIEVELPLNGRVEVTVWDKESRMYINGAEVVIKNKAGDTLSEPKASTGEGKAEFTGFEENEEVYAFVRAEGYLDYGSAQDVRPVSYSSTLRLTASMERDGSVIQSIITILPVDVHGDAVDGVTALLSNIDNDFVGSKTGNISFEVDSRSLYNAALHKPGFLRVLLEGISAGTHTAEMLVSNSANAGDITICLDADINGMLSPATGTVELFSQHGRLLDRKDSIGGDNDSCVTFHDLPQGWQVYARASSDGHEPVESELHTILARQDGENLIGLTFGSLPQNAAAVGDIKVCVADETGSAIGLAEVLLYDYDLEGPGWDGDFRLATASDGCAIFRDIPIEKTDYEGILSPVMVYAIVSAQNYAAYNGKAEGNVVEVQANRITPLNVRMSPGQSICISAMSGGTPLAGAGISLCANALCNQMLETKTAESDGHVLFSSNVASVTVKVVPGRSDMEDEKIQSFPLSEVTQGQCGRVDIESISQYTSVSLDGLWEGLVEVEPYTSNEIEFVVLIDGAPMTGGAMPTGGDNRVLADDGTEVLLEVSGDIEGGTIRTVDATLGSYAMPFIAPGEAGSYQMTLSASIMGCDSCRGDERRISVRVIDYEDDIEDEDPGYYEPPSTEETAEDYYSDTTTSTEEVISNLESSYGQQMYQNSIQVCIVDADTNEPIYDSSIKTYHTGGSALAGASSGPSYASPQQMSGYGQQWQETRRIQNCRVFLGYTSTQGMATSTILSSFHIQASANGYEEYDSSKARESIDVALAGPNGFLTITVKLKRSGSARMGEGTITNPARELELRSADWKAQGSDRRDSTTIHPLVTNIDRDIILAITYTIDMPTGSSLDYSVDYKVSGNDCYEIEAYEAREGEIGRSLSFWRGQQVVEDLVTLHTKDSCWNNNPELEKAFTISLEGRLLQIGERETKGQSFAPVRVSVNPAVGATKTVRGLSGLQSLSGSMEFSQGVATIGQLPYCIPAEAKTGDGHLVSSRQSDPAAAEKKIVIEFKPTSFPDTLDDLVGRVEEYIRTRIRKAPMDCKAYIKVLDEGMGKIEVGQTGFGCHDASSPEGARQAQPWERLFCETIAKGASPQLTLGGSYEMRTESR